MLSLGSRKPITAGGVINPGSPAAILDNFNLHRLFNKHYHSVHSDHGVGLRLDTRVPQNAGTLYALLPVVASIYTTVQVC